LRMGARAEGGGESEQGEKEELGEGGGRFDWEHGEDLEWGQALFS
jgi:hypothetical protein